MAVGATLTFGAARITPIVELVMPTSVRWLLPEHPDPAGLRDAAASWLRPDFMNERGHLLQTMQAFVIEVDGLTVVVDTGIGNDKERPGAAPAWHRRSGPFLDDFRAAGFDPETVEDRATFEVPRQFPAGIPHVFVGGTAVVRHERLTGNLPGQVLRRGGGAAA